MTTPGDRAVLNAIFNPMFPDLSEDLANDDENRPVEGSGDEKTNDEKPNEFEVEAIKMAENGDLDCALNMLNRALDQNPQKASIFNNRAQVFRLKNNTEAAKVDLDRAIELTQGKGKVASQAYVQRALIARLVGKENEAAADFESAAKLGSQFAHSQLVLMNPYAALCNKMLMQMTKSCGEPKSSSSQNLQ